MVLAVEIRALVEVGSKLLMDSGVEMMAALQFNVPHFHTTPPKISQGQSNKNTSLFRLGLDLVLS